MQAQWISEDAPAKVNLALHLRRRRADGYHDLETIFAFTDFGDTLIARQGDTLSLKVEGEFAAVVGEGENNLVLRAALALQAEAKLSMGADLRLQKRIPVAAGLGGGSADAAAALRLLNRLWDLDWPLDRLEVLAKGLGADVPACVRSRTSLGTGRGEALLPWPNSLSATPMLLVNPGVAVPTGPVFKAWDQIDRGGIDPFAPIGDLRNDMTAAATALAPVIADVLIALAATQGVTLVRMSGSGATCFGLFEDTCARDAAASAMAGQGWWVAATALR